MGRSKPSLTPGAMKSPAMRLASTNSLKSPKPVFNKSAAKRPLPSASDSEEEEESVTLPLDSEFPKNKKGRFSQPQLENDFASDDDDEEEEDDDEDEEEEGSENSDAEKVDDADDGDEDEDDDEEDEDEDSDDDGDDSAPDSAGSVENAALDSSLAKINSVRSTNVNSTVHSPPKTSMQGGEAQMKPDTQSEKRPLDSDMFVIPHPPKNIQDLRNVMEKAGYSVTDICMLNVPLALATVASVKNLKSEKSGFPPLSLNGSAVHIIHLDGPKESLSKLTTAVTTTIIVTGIPKSVTLELLLSALPQNCQPISSKLLNKGPKNKTFNAAILSFSDKQISSSAHAALSRAKFENCSVRSAFIKDRDEASQSDSLRGCTKCLLVSQLPPTVTETQLKNIFTTALNFKLMTKNGETQCLLTFADENAAVNAFDTHCNDHLGKSKLILRFTPAHEAGGRIQAYVDRVPHEATVSQVIAAFPGATNASKLSSGTYIVSFPSAEIRQKAILEKRSISNSVLSVSVDGGLDGNIMFVRNVPFAATEEDLRSVYPEATKIVVHVKPNGRSNGTATVDFPSSKQCLATLGKKLNLMGRPLVQSLKRIAVGSETTSTVQTQKRKPEKSPAPPAISAKAPLQVGSDSEDSNSDDQEESMDEDMEHTEPVNKKAKITPQGTKVLRQSASESESGDEALGPDADEDETEDDDDEDDGDEDDEEEDEDDEDDDDEDEGVEDESDDDDEPPQKNQKHHVSQKQGIKMQNDKSGNHDKNRGIQSKKNRGFKHNSGSYNRDSQRGGGFDRNSQRGGGSGRDSQRGGGFDRNSQRGGGFDRNSQRGGGRGFKRGFGGGGGFNRGAGGRGSPQNRGGFRGKHFKKN